MNRREALVLRAFVVWTFYVWITRLWNIWRDTTRDVPFKLVHTALAVISCAFAVVTWRIVHNVRHRERVDA
jgi:hypothetical protein